MKKYLVVIDMQKDFVSGVLGTKEAMSIVPNVVEKVKNFDGTIIFTKDTHGEDYLFTQEGRKLPVVHCVAQTDGWNLVDELEELCKEHSYRIYEKGTFGCARLAEDLKAEQEKEAIDSIELIGVCTDICVISNAMLIKAFLPEVEIKVDSTCCAGVTIESHKTALESMKACQIEIK